MGKNVKAVADELLMSRIHEVRGHKVMLDRDLAELFGVPTKALKQAVRRNTDRFPGNFMFEMRPHEFEQWRSHFVTSNSGDRMGLRYAPFCFTEHGVLMLANVLKSKQAIAMSIRIIEVFTRMRQMLMTHKDLLLEMERIRSEVSDHGKQLELIFAYLRQLEERAQQEPQPRKRIGYKKEQ